MAAPVVRNWIGTRQGHVTIVARGPVDQESKQQCSLWVGRCDCGRERLVSSKALKKQKVKTCGNRKCKYRKPLRLGAGLYSKPDAKWGLSCTEVEHLKQQNCYVCGAAGPCGIELLNPRKPYTVANVFSICPVCAKAKGKMLLQRFLELVAAIHQRHFPRIGQ